MTLLDRRSPLPRDCPGAYQRFVYPALGKQYLPVPPADPLTNVGEVLSNRKSRRDYLRLPVSDLSSLLWYAAKSRSLQTSEDGRLWQHRPAPSAGGLHPIDLIVSPSKPASELRQLFLYDASAHALLSLQTNAESSREFFHDVNEVLPIENATILWFVSEPDRTLSRYRDGESLIWLDAGALLTTIYITSEALGLACCAIGRTGEPWISSALYADNCLHGLCGCLVGRRIG
ncbi:MAG: hypothetical protein QOF01_527 [Thermomicrobiales bacterium]|nr:hypothetical protein [Thermomicrobiales bacterium]